MKKNELVWRLSEKPTIEDITKLSERGLVTKEEARELLFKTREKISDTDQIKDELKMLRELVQTIASRPYVHEVVRVIKQYEPSPWIKPWVTWCSSLPGTVTSGSTVINTAAGNAMTLPSFNTTAN